MKREAQGQTGIIKLWAEIHELLTTMLNYPPCIKCVVCLIPVPLGSSRL